ncbi:hypothetical protein CPLU01_12996 [Colletotrichum plurivorum]|uniref:Uncharacterized protein n=1 Tax=Colletotrichum plurivorum TaxID=2175906 RepID=A0A8H6N4T7_9PEZI|nr:hypothetical protein CPLU01_12996 [Colletotrichum plurivorum]
MRDPTEETRLPALARRWTPEVAVKSRERETSLRDWCKSPRPKRHAILAVQRSSVVEGRSTWARVDRLLTFWKNSAAAEAGRWTSRRLVRSMAPFEKRGAHKTTRYRPAPSPPLANRLSEAGGEGKVPERKVQLCQAQGCVRPSSQNQKQLQLQLQLQLAAAIYGYRSGSVFSPITSFRPAAYGFRPPISSSEAPCATHPIAAGPQTRPTPASDPSRWPGAAHPDLSPFYSVDTDLVASSYFSCALHERGNSSWPSLGPPSRPLVSPRRAVLRLPSPPPRRRRG